MIAMHNNFFKFFSSMDDLVRPVLDQKLVIEEDLEQVFCPFWFLKHSELQLAYSSTEFLRDRQDPSSPHLGASFQAGSFVLPNNAPSARHG